MLDKRGGVQVCWAKLSSALMPGDPRYFVKEGDSNRSRRVNFHVSYFGLGTHYRMEGMRKQREQEKSKQDHSTTR